ncbi:hypothetical protein FSP39_011884 [Pinctada imbricata]|uniref:Paraneoplastic antigen Ma-like C-terminal domain-containing protein n=1 Tax=Pinctada imbricata TaxID=66713 RepID=A0AA88XU46_PINIB|nr:hypothetical protein FSP39_011884 [Pinctada imbricata]
MTTEFTNSENEQNPQEVQSYNEENSIYSESRMKRCPDTYRKVIDQGSNEFFVEKEQRSGVGSSVESYGNEPIWNPYQGFYGGQRSHGVPFDYDIRGVTPTQQVKFPPTGPINGEGMSRQVHETMYPRYPEPIPNWGYPPIFAPLGPPGWYPGYGCPWFPMPPPMYNQYNVPYMDCFDPRWADLPNDIAANRQRYAPYPVQNCPHANRNQMGTTEERGPNERNGSLVSNIEPHGQDQIVYNQTPAPEVIEVATSQDQGISDESELRLVESMVSMERNLESIPKTIRYNGTDNWEAFKMKFTVFAQAKQWTELESRGYLCWCLEGQASEFYTSVVKRDPGVRFADLMTKLEMRFGDCELPETAQVKFSTLVQNPDESLEEWSDRVQQVAAKAFQGLPDDFQNKQVIYRICHGCLDQNAGQFVVNLNLSSILEVIDRIKHYQFNHLAISKVEDKGVVCSPYSGDHDYKEITYKGHEPFPVSYRVSSVGKTDCPQSSDLEKRVSALELQLGDICAQLKAIACNFESDQGHASWSSSK